MNKTEQKIVKAFFNQNGKTIANTTILIDGQTTFLILYGSIIAKYEQGTIYIRHKGHISKLTKSRLSAIISYATNNIMSVKIKDGKMYLYYNDTIVTALEDTSYIPVHISSVFKSKGV